MRNKGGNQREENSGNPGEKDKNRGKRGRNGITDSPPFFTDMSVKSRCILCPFPMKPPEIPSALYEVGKFFARIL